jgi:ADP-ribosylation factor family
MTVYFQRLAGASLLVFANKQDIQGSMTDQEIEQASSGDVLDRRGLSADVGSL